MNSTVAKSYAKAIYSLAGESNVDVAKELTSLTEVINENNDLENVLFLDLFTVEEKTDVLNSVLAKLSVSPITKNFLSFLLTEKRIGILPLIFKEVIVLDDAKRGFLRGTIEGAADQADEKAVAELKTYLEKTLGSKTELSYVKNEKITAGYKVTVDDLQLDATIDNQLNKLKEEILNS